MITKWLTTKLWEKVWDYNLVNEYTAFMNDSCQLLSKISLIFTGSEPGVNFLLFF